MRFRGVLRSFGGVVVIASLVGACSSSSNGKNVPATTTRPGATTVTTSKPSEAKKEAFGLITVSGHGVISSIPDTLTIMLGVQTIGRTAKDALGANNTKANILIAALKGQGVAEKDIQTTDLSVNPFWDAKGKRIIGYGAGTNVTAKTHALKRAGEIIDSVTTAVGDEIRVNGISFSIEQTGDLVAKARADAVKKAAAQALQLATAAGVKPGRIKTIDETNRNNPVPQYYQLQRAAFVATDAANIQPGTQELSIDVQMVYEIDQ